MMLPFSNLKFKKMSDLIILTAKVFEIVICDKGV